MQTSDCGAFMRQLGHADFDAGQRMSSGANHQENKGMNRTEDVTVVVKYPQRAWNF
jgi:hypothetical protein